MKIMEIIRIVALILGFLGVYYVASMVSLKRNVIKVIRIFEDKKALTDKTAVSVESLGIIKQDLLARTVKRRDNRIHALKFLMGYEFVVTTADEKCYLDKKKMATFRKDGNFLVRFIIPNLSN